MLSYDYGDLGDTVQAAASMHAALRSKNPACARQLAALAVILGFPPSYFESGFQDYIDRAEMIDHSPLNGITLLLVSMLPELFPDHPSIHMVDMGCGKQGAVVPRLLRATLPAVKACPPSGRRS